MKTPEELAEEYTKDWWGNLPEAEGMRKSARENFLAGYQAAKDQLADVSIVIDPVIEKRCKTALVGNDDEAGDLYIEHLEQLIADHNADASKMVWISVKDRLPELGEHGYSEDVLLLSQVGRMEVSSIQKVKRVVKWRGVEPVIETENGTPIEHFTHWMPLPQPPKEK